MNGVHDMGGMEGLGDYGYEVDEPVFHARWEGRVYAMNRAMGAWRRWNLDAWRFDIEQLPPWDYLRMSYYEKWLTALEKRVVKYGFVSAAEFQTGKALEGERATPKLTVEGARRLDRGLPSSLDPSVAAGFAVGQEVRARLIQPRGHTRLPRYARGKNGVIAADRGVHVFPDTNAKYEGESRQHLYSVRFLASELWCEEANPRDSVYLDLWEAYLEAR
jgi:nitrile hydratase subunit beta